MIHRTVQPDIGILLIYLFFSNIFQQKIENFLLISTRKSQFETDLECDNDHQTRQHTMLLKTAAVRYLVVQINQMDNPIVNWNHIRDEQIKDKLTEGVVKHLIAV